MTNFNSIRENYWYFLLIFTIIILFAFFVWSRKLYQKKTQIKKTISDQKKQAKKIEEREKKIEIDKKNLTTSIEKIKLIENQLHQEKKRISNFADQLLCKEELFTKQLLAITQREKTIQEEIEKNEKIKSWIVDKLEKTISMSKEEAKKKLFLLLKEEIEQDLERYKEEKIKKTEEKIKEESTKIICLALEKYSSELVFTKTTSTVQLSNKQIISKIIGKEGRNINFFRQITGTELVINKENKDSLTIQISSFNSLRREIACQTLHALINDEKISPIQIEKKFYQISSEIDSLIIRSGQEVLKELKLTNIHPDLVKYLGKLKYRTSYGQNVLEHCLEVAKLAGNIATELGLDAVIARRAGLFHDIGKSVDDENGNSHVTSGIELAKKYKEPDIVINAIASHHRDFPVNNLYSLIIIAADKLSATRVGVRGHQLEVYVERMNKLEKIAKEFPGIKKTYAFQAGREIWVIADAEKISDYQTWEISQKIKDKIKKNIIIPGEVTIYIVREKRFVLNTVNLRKNVPPETLLNKQKWTTEKNLVKKIKDKTKKNWKNHVTKEKVEN